MWCWLDDVAESRLRDILEVAQELAGHLEGRSKAAFRADRGLQRVTERLVEIAGEAATHVPDEVAGAIEADWQGIRAMRVVLAHAYHRIDLDILWEAASRSLPRFASAVAAHLQ
ncbi:MAG TPA: HepT-like ribonuclease domain-containing protein [Candidatus Thermoplasmatota archaeon]|nr:HepT-like ribonuclease domain-containing protein [Candidatus Thermoplasmatota archaeon]